MHSAEDDLQKTVQLASSRVVIPIRETDIDDYGTDVTKEFIKSGPGENLWKTLFEYTKHPLLVSAIAIPLWNLGVVPLVKWLWEWL